MIAYKVKIHSKAGTVEKYYSDKAMAKRVLAKFKSQDKVGYLEEILIESPKRRVSRIRYDGSGSGEWDTFFD